MIPELPTFPLFIIPPSTAHHEEREGSEEGSVVVGADSATNIIYVMSRLPRLFLGSSGDPA